jgi:integrase/recombinase XerD
MAISRCYRLSYAAWPEEDRRLWEEKAKEADLFSEERPLSRLPAKRRYTAKSDYSAFLGFVATQYPGRLKLAPGARVDRDLVVDWVQRLLQQYRGTTVKIMVDSLRLLLTAFCEVGDWSWLRAIANRAISIGRPKPKKERMTSDVLYALGIRLMDTAMAEEASAVVAMPVRRHPTRYRDGLMIALLAECPLRRRAFANLQVGKQLVKSGGLWALAIPAEDTKTRVPLEYPISANLSARIDTYLLNFRSRWLTAESDDDFLWLSLRGRPLSGAHIAISLARRTSDAFGFVVGPHRFRHAAATFMCPSAIQPMSGLLRICSAMLRSK